MDEEQTKSSSSSNSSSSIVMDDQSNAGNSNSDSNQINSNITKAPEQMLPISTSSSWTILPPDRIEFLEASSSSEELEQQAKAKEDEQNNAECKLVEDADTQAEDVSDGISIISDCESTGRISPHPFLREHLNELSFKFDEGHGVPLVANMPNLNAGQEMRERRRRASNPILHLKNNVAQPEAPSTDMQRRHRMLPLVHNGLTAVFYVGATLAVLALIGRLQNPEWKVLCGNEPVPDVAQRLEDLELQNNLMRAEIDIMSKQLLYLSSINGQGHGPGQGQGQGHGHGHGHGQGQAQPRKPKTFKAWPGNGDSVEPVDITKADLKRPYKCPDGKYVEIAAMCMEIKPHAESLADEIGDAVNDVLRQSQAFHDFEKVTERLGTLAGEEETPTPTPDDGASDPSKAFHVHGDKMRAPPLEANKQRYTNGDASKERYKTKYNNNAKWQDSKEHKYDSKEYKYSSKERRNRMHLDNSKEQRHGRKQRHDGDDDDSASGEWHERMMQHRENARQRHDKKRNNNWFIERGGGREQIRSSETRR
ncbi:hypothetical protein AWZ03_012707 [Drosophila navojoa]|uniref:Uncharacterized protein n=1 Tax=Drosophila navojoa TaxID=7232 RepID=A0A484AW93_DRONA|nr:uncharacterized protein LOC115564576 [Drosophila navojoa]TDG40869.1 hypothetical protein AWZ03_012707 [Drosophila navojoa]